jgi:hypothetical protein
MAKTLAWSLARLSSILEEPLSGATRPSYSAGTITWTSGSATISGSGSTWGSNIEPGSTFNKSGNRYYHIKSVDSDTALTLTDTITDATSSGTAIITAGKTTLATMVDMLEAAQWEAVNKIKERDENLMATSGTISYVSGTETYALPTSGGSVKTILYVERTDLATRKMLHKINYQDRIKYSLPNTVSDADSFREYFYLLGDTIGIVPTPTESATANVTISYIPIVTAPTKDSSTFTVPDDMMEWVLYIAAAKVKADLAGERDRQESMALGTINRQLQEPRSVNNVCEEDF